MNVIYRNSQWCVMNTGAMVSPDLNVTILARDVCSQPLTGWSLYSLPSVAYEEACSPEMFCKAWLKAVYLIEETSDNDCAGHTVNELYAEREMGFPDWKNISLDVGAQL